MKTIRLFCKQNLVNYRKPMSYTLKETYPLPPYATVIGMIHKACDFNEYHPMQISVQGNPLNTISDIYTRYTFSGGKGYEKDRHNLCVSDKEGNQYGIVRSVGNIELITEISLLIHICPEREEDFDIILHALQKPKTFLSLGRHEDLLNIERIDVVECEKTESAFSKMSAYLPIVNQEETDEVEGTVYKVYKTFTVNQKNRRIFDKPIRVKYIPSNRELSDIYTDIDGNPVYLV